MGRRGSCNVGLQAFNRKVAEKAAKVARKVEQILLAILARIFFAPPRG